MKQRNEAQRLGIGDGRDEKAENFAQGKGGAKISHKGMCCANFAQRDVLCENFAQGTIHPLKCKIGFFQMAITSSFQIQIAHCFKALDS